MTKLWGLLEYKPQWTLTLRGWLLIVLGATVTVILLVFYIHPFLAYSRPIKAEILVVEGWVSDEVISGAIAEFHQNHYQLLITTGSLIPKGSLLCPYKSQAELAAATAIALGLDKDKVRAVPSPLVTVNRTEASAKAVKKWLLQTDLAVKAINLYSFDVHTRRSWLIFQGVFAPIKVGAIAHPPIDYDAQRWWLTSSGVRSVISEGIAYLYARLTGY